jgi:hypothetical protein
MRVVGIVDHCDSCGVETISSETKPVCPFCQSTLTVRLGCETHCNSCGKSFALDRNPISTIALNRKAAASPSTGYGLHPGNECLSELEQAINSAEREFSEAVLNVCRHRGDAEELRKLRQAERDAKAKLDKLLADRGELATHRSDHWH